MLILQTWLSLQNETYLPKDDPQKCRVSWSKDLRESYPETVHFGTGPVCCYAWSQRGAWKISAAKRVGLNDGQLWHMKLLPGDLW